MSSAFGAFLRCYRPTALIEPRRSQPALSQPSAAQSGSLAVGLAQVPRIGGDSLLSANAASSSAGTIGSASYCAVTATRYHH